MHFSSSLTTDSLSSTLPVGARANERPASNFISPDQSAGSDFASVLSQVNEPSAHQDAPSNSSDDPDEDAEEEKKKKDAANRGPTADQIAAALALTQTSLTGATVAPPAPQGRGDGLTLNLVDGQGRTISQLLAEGKSTLEFQAVRDQNKLAGSVEKKLAAQEESATAVPSTLGATADHSPLDLEAATSAKAKEPLANVGAEAKISALPSLATSAPDSLKKTAGLNTSVGPSGVTSPAALSALAGQEKFADQSNQQKGSGDNASDQNSKNATLVIGAKEFKTSKGEIGTVAANGVKPMLHDVRTTVSPALPTDSAFSAATGSAAGTTMGAASPADVTRSAASHAADLVHQIHDIGEGLWSVDRQSVEVNFNFGEKEHLSVRVQYKDGQVQATFNTDSADLRAAISHAWNSQNTSADSRSFRMADPVFTGSSSDSSSSGNRSKQSSPPPDALASSFSRARSSSNARVDASTASSRANLRPEIAGRLNVIV